MNRRWSIWASNGARRVLLGLRQLTVKIVEMAQIKKDTPRAVGRPDRPSMIHGATDTVPKSRDRVLSDRCRWRAHPRSSGRARRAQIWVIFITKPGPSWASEGHANLPSSRATAHPLARVVAISQSVSRTRRLARPRGGGPGSGLGSGSGTGADRPFRIVKSETMKRVDHKR